MAVVQNTILFLSLVNENRIYCVPNDAITDVDRVMLSTVHNLSVRQEKTSSKMHSVEEILMIVVASGCQTF
jgi:hypothetical protein